MCTFCGTNNNELYSFPIRLNESFAFSYDANTGLDFIQSSHFIHVTSAQPTSELQYRLNRSAGSNEPKNVIVIVLLTEIECDVNP
jgi:hypothetical protein